MHAASRFTEQSVVACTFLAETHWFTRVHHHLASIVGFHFKFPSLKPKKILQ